MFSESFVSQNCVLATSKFRNWMFVWILTVARRTLGPTCVFIWTQFLFNTTFCWSATILTLVNNLYRISVNTLWITIKPAGRSDRISKSNLQNLYSWTLRQFNMLILCRRYVLNLNTANILTPFLLHISGVGVGSNRTITRKLPQFHLILDLFSGDIFRNIWSRNLFTPGWPLIFSATAPSVVHKYIHRKCDIHRNFEIATFFCCFSGEQMNWTMQSWIGRHPSSLFLSLSAP